MYPLDLRRGHVEQADFLSEIFNDYLHSQEVEIPNQST